MPEGKKINLTEAMLEFKSLKRTIRKHFLPIFHPDKNVAADEYAQKFREEVFKILNNLQEKIK